jgi:sugar lactone lactonase YvrE
VDAFGRIYVTDGKQNTIHKFDPKGVPLLAFSDPQLKAPEGIAVDRGGAIFVTDGLRRSVFVFAPDGKRIREIRRGSRTFDVPLDLALDAEGNLYVTEHYGGMVHKLTPRGRRLQSWKSPEEGKPGHFHHVLRVCLAPDGFAYLADVNNGRVQKRSLGGDLVDAWPLPDHPTVNLRGWSDMAVSDKRIFLLDVTNGGGLQVWTTDGRLVLAESLGGRVRHSDHNIPTMAWSPLGELLIFEPAECRMLRFRVNLP